MTAFSRRSFTGLGLAAAAMPLSARPAPPSAARVERAVREALQGKSSGAALVAKRGRILWRGAVRSGDAAMPPASADMVFDALSIGKTFTAIAVLRLAERGAIDLNQKIRFYLPELGEAFADLKVRHALNNDCGLPTYLEGGDLDPRTAAQALAEIAAMKPARKGGTGYQYSNVGFQLLGLLLERIGKRPLREVITEHVFMPAGLQHTGFIGASSYGGAPVATGYVDGKAVGDLTRWPETWSLLGAAGIATTVDDLYRLNRIFLAGAGLSNGTRARLLLSGAPTYGRGPYITPDTIDISYGSGLFHWIDRAGRHVAFHGGDGGFGFNAVMFWREEDDVFVAVMMNSRRTDNPLDRGDMMTAILRELD